ncbi:PKD domain-containing protein [bacterium]|nr:PKD domain-containing protein [bacterium]
MFSSLRGYHNKYLIPFFLTCFFSIYQTLYSVNINNMRIIEEVTLEKKGYSPDIALHPTDGSLHVAWVNDTWDIQYKVRNYNGAWSQVNTVPDAGLHVRGMEEDGFERKCLGMCIDYQGTTHIVFSESGGDVYYVSGVLGKWSDPVRLVKKSGYSIYLDIVSVGNNIYAVYEDADRDDVYGIYRIGGSWKGPYLVAPGEYPSLAVGSQNRVYFLCRGGRQITEPFHQAKFAVLKSGQTAWQFKTNMTNPEGRTGQGPRLTVSGGEIYLAWSMGIDDPDVNKKTRLFCATANEPGNSWTPRLDEVTLDPWDQPYYENTGDPHSNVSVYSDGLVIHMNGGRNERFRLWDGNDWTVLKEAPWNDDDDWGAKNILQVVNDGRTAWIVRSSSGASDCEIAISGITNPSGQILKPPPPDAVQDLKIITKKVLSTTGFSGDVSVDPTDGSLHAVWVQDGGIQYAIRSTDGPWSSAENVPTGGRTVHGEHQSWPRPCLALDVDHTGASHLIFSTYAGKLFYLRGQGGIWETPVEISDHDNYLIYPDIEVWQNTISVIYEYVHAPNCHIYTIQSVNGQWEQPVFLGEGDNPVFAQGKEGRLYFCYRSVINNHDLNFGWCLPGFTDWETKSSIIAPENQSGASPGMCVWDDQIYIAWNNDTGEESSDYKSQLFCTIGNEPGQNWLTGQGSYGPIYSENTSDPHTRISAYSDGHVLYLNGRRMENRFAIYNGETWSVTRTGPWADGYPNVDTDGKTVWVMVTSNSKLSDQVSVTGIQKPDAETYEFETPGPQIAVDVDTVEAEIGQTFDYHFSQLFEDGQSLTITRSTVTSLLNGMVFDEIAQTLTWTPQSSDITADLWGEGPGKHLFGITVTTSYGKSMTLYFWIKVVNASQNQFPQITSSPVTEVDAGDSYAYTVIAFDPEGDALTFHLNQSPGDMTIHAQSGAISWNPVSEDEGAHDVEVIVTDTHGNFVTQSFTLNVGVQSVPAPDALFTVDVTEGIYPLQVVFSNQSTGIIDTYTWDFGDFETGSVQNPVHVFQWAGVYTVQLIVSGPGGADTLRIPDLIHVLEPPPEAGFIVNQPSGSAPLTVQFTDTSHGAVILWHWDFGDSTQSTLQHPEHIYHETGWYSVFLRVTGPGGSDSVLIENLIQVGSAPPIAAFSSDTTSGEPPLTVHFIDQSQGNVNSYFWDFGDSTTSTLQHPEHTYSDIGIYSVFLKVSGPGGSDSVAVDSLICIGFNKPIAVFSADTTWGQAPLTVQFSDWSYGEVNQYAWDFGDGETSIEIDPVHLYQNSGEYTVCLIVSGPGGADTLTVHQMIHVGSTQVAAQLKCPQQFHLHPNAPNPFNPATQIIFDLPQSEQVKITVFDLCGHRIAVLKEGLCSAGRHSVAWNGFDDNGSAVASGMYVIVMEAGRYRAQRKAIFMK